jgi:DNA polymerase I-like protein with 3'-5' exonuclease and polymerase domains
MTLLQAQTLWEPTTVETRHKQPKEQFPSLAGQGAIAFDLETNDPELRKRGPGAHRGGTIAGIAIGTEAGFRGYYPIGHENDEDNLPREKVLAWLRQQLALPVPKIGAHLLYDLIFLDAAGVKSCGPYWDVEVAEPLIDENRHVYNLDSLARKYLKTGKHDEVLMAWVADVLGVKRHHKEHIWRVPAKIVAKYAIGDVDLPLRIFKQQAAKLKTLDLWNLFLMESKLIPMLVAMHRRGVPVDIDAAERLYRSMAERQSILMAQIKQQSGLGIAPWNARSIAKVFDKLGLSLRIDGEDRGTVIHQGMAGASRPSDRQADSRQPASRQVEGNLRQGCRTRKQLQGAHPLSVQSIEIGRRRNGHRPLQLVLPKPTTNPDQG